ncbi:hypothetical protein JOE66_000338 [Subtercola frigoramans]|uniref:Uncharacterized protein n=1 Tax=Subtercola frigoramans TaxID=120298 RepID=A0ABS2L0Y8_9MICO|nr:hypothetical protein [Subtercola frigoramans]
MQRRNVDFPEPDGPMMHATSPRLVERDPLEYLDAAEGLVDLDGANHDVGWRSKRVFEELFSHRLLNPLP